MISSFYLIVIFILGLLFFASAVGALVWASRTGQLRNFDRGSRTIFDEEEPEGVMQDGFPHKKHKTPRRRPQSPPHRMRTDSFHPR